MSNLLKTESKEVRELLDCAQEALVSLHATDVHVVDVQGRSSVTDFFVICTANSRPHLKAVGDGLERALRDAGHRCHRKAGDAASEWMVLDFVNVVTHVMTEETRTFYALEQLWSEGPSTLAQAPD